MNTEIIAAQQSVHLPTVMPSADPPSVSSRPSKPFSISFGSARPKTGSAPVPKKRPHSALADHSDGEDEGPPAAELVSGFDHSGAVVTNGVKEEKPLLVIPVEKNRDWREESRKKRRKNILPAEVQAARSGTYEDLKAAQVERDEVSKESGISFVQKDQDGDTAMGQEQAYEFIPEQPPQSTKTADEEAMEALLGGERKSNLIIATLGDERDGYEAQDDAYDDYANEDDRFKADIASRPDVASLDAYMAVPVDGFGAGILRGQGWKDGDPIGKRRTRESTTSKPRVVERRPAFLGIGAKEVPTGVGDEELGAWGKGAKGKRKADLIYNPVILKNSKTGEMLTEEELEKKKLEQKAKEEEEYSWRERKDKNLAIDARKKEERRERLMIEENGHSSSRHSSSRRKRSRSMERRRRDRSRSDERSSHGSSRRRSRSRDRNHHHGSSRRDRSPHKSSRRERSRSDERRYRW